MNDLSKYMDKDNPLYQKLMELYDINDGYPKNVVQGRNLHHKKLRSWSKRDKEEVDNSNENLVSLSNADHILAHYYIWKCSKTPYKASAAIAWWFMSKTLLKWGLDDSTVEEMVHNYQQEIEVAYEEARLEQSLSRKGKKPKNFELFLKKAHEANRNKAQTPDVIKHRSERYLKMLERRKEERRLTSELKLLRCIEFDEIHKVTTWRKYEIRADRRGNNCSYKGLHFEYVFKLKKDFVETELSSDLQNYLKDYHDRTYHWEGRSCDCCGDPDVSKYNHKQFLDKKWHLCYNCYRLIIELRKMSSSEFERLDELYKKIYSKFIIK